ncbi:MAG: aminotransferase class I/II-fold pyridoxal phosphate-dependent enzyme, partial [Aurantibacter sp.]
MPDLPKKLQSKLAGRAKDYALRKLPVISSLVDFSSNDYLGFARDENIHDFALNLLSESGQVQNGATGSRLLSGNHPLYEKLEGKLAETFEAESTLFFNSGYDANVGFFSTVPQRGDIIFYDEFIHAS